MSEELQSRTPSRVDASSKSRGFMVPFLGFLLIGALALKLAPPSLWWLPVLVMFCYLGWGVERAKELGLAAEFADSFYYLGFGLTLFALLETTGVLGGVLPPARDMIIEFGKALSTTIFGVIGRVAFQLHFRVTQDALQEATKTVLDAANALVETLEKSKERIARQLAEEVENAEGLRGLRRKEIEAFEHSEKAHENLVDVHNDLARQQWELAKAVSRHSKALDGANVGASIQRLEQSLEAANRLISRPETTAAEVPSVHAALVDAVGEIQALEAEVATIRGNINSVSHAAGEVEGALKEVCGALTTRMGTN